MSKIGTAEVNRIAALARIGLTPDEASLMAAEIGRIIEFVEQLQSVDIEGIPPTDQVTGLEDVWREDVVVPSMPRDELLANAPQSQDGYIVVKRVLNG
jgi:aspartyl-tRNA(Asn)/glutamyl-tRNA(Gln) amidotransferase subunit C